MSSRLPSRPHENGLALAARYNLSTYDAMIAASALHAGCDTLWSEDMPHDMALDEGLRIVNPFRIASCGSSGAMAALSPIAAWLDLYVRGLAGDQEHPVGHMVDLYTHRNPLRKPYPGKDRVDIRKPRLAPRGVSDRDAAGNARNMTLQRRTIAHQLDGRAVTRMDRAERGFLEICVNPKGIRIDD